MSSAWRDWVRISWPMKSMELDFDVEVLEAAQPHGGSYLALVFTFVKSGRKIYRGSIFFLFHGNGGRSSRVRVLVHAIVASAWHLGRYFLFQGGFWGGWGAEGALDPEHLCQQHRIMEHTRLPLYPRMLVLWPLLSSGAVGYSRAHQAGCSTGCGIVGCEAVVSG